MFEVDPVQVASLGDADARELIARLVECELTAQRHPTSALTWGGHQDAPDGGIDVRVSLSATSQVIGFIPRPSTGYQIKAGKFAPADISDEMAPNDSLRHSIKELVKAGGAYIIVAVAESVADSNLTRRITAMKVELAKYGVDTTPSSHPLMVDFYDQRRVTDWVNKHPSAIAWVYSRCGQATSGWSPYGHWAGSPATADESYLIDEHATMLAPGTSGAVIDAHQGLDAIRQCLERPGSVVRLVGLSGVGKTRFAEAIFDERVGPRATPRSLALYTDGGGEQTPTATQMIQQLAARQQRAVVVVDNCGAQLHRELARHVQRVPPIVSLLTIEYDVREDGPEDTEVFRLQGSSSLLLDRLLQRRHPALSELNRGVIVRLSEGNARVALALAGAARQGESLANLNDSELFDRLFWQQQDPDGELLDTAKACALLYSFEVSGGETSEIPRLARLVGQPSLTFHKHVAELLRRQLMQRRGKWAAILPHAIAYRLARRAMEDIPRSHIEAVMFESESTRMLRSFARRLSGLHDHPRAAEIAQTWLAQDGLLANIGKLNALGSTLFELIAPICPEVVIALCERCASGQEEWFNRTDNANRASIVRVLRACAYEPELFIRCASLLMRFSAAGRQDGDDVAFGALRSLFPIYLSGSHAPAEVRAAFIQRNICEGDKVTAGLSVALLAEMLKTDMFTSHHPFEFGARVRDYGSHPSSRDDIQTWYASALVAAECAGVASGSAGRAVRSLFAQRVTSLVQVGMTREVVRVAESYAASCSWTEGWIGVKSALRKMKSLQAPSEKEELQRIEGRLRPTTLRARLHAYAYSEEWSALDIADLQENEESDPVGAREKIREYCDELGTELGACPHTLNEELHDLLDSSSEKVGNVGLGIARRCESLESTWDTLLAAWSARAETRGSAVLLGGFLTQAAERAPAVVEQFLDNALSDERCHSHFVYFQACVGMRGHAAERLDSALRRESIPVSTFLVLARGRVHESLADDVVGEIALQLQAKPGGEIVAIELLGARMYCARSSKQVVSESLRLSARLLLRRLRFENDARSVDHLLDDLVEVGFEGGRCESESREVCVLIECAVRDARISAYSVFGTVEALSKVNPTAYLDTFVEESTEGTSASSHVLVTFGSERGCPLRSVPIPVWLDWAMKKPNARYVQLARGIRITELPDDEAASVWSDAASALIDAAPQPVAVLEVFLERFRCCGWSGRVTTMLSRLPMMEMLHQHARHDVAQWSREHIGALRAFIEEERQRDAAFSRDHFESFE